jgi:hypothetical protein
MLPLAPAPTSTKCSARPWPIAVREKVVRLRKPVVRLVAFTRCRRSPIRILVKRLVNTIRVGPQPREKGRTGSVATSM